VCPEENMPAPGAAPYSVPPGEVLASTDAVILISNRMVKAVAVPRGVPPVLEAGLC